MSFALFLLCVTAVALGWVYKKGLKEIVIFESHMELRELVLRHILTHYTLHTEEEINQYLAGIVLLPDFNLILSIDGIWSYETEALNFQVSRLAYMTKEITFKSSNSRFNVVGDKEHNGMTVAQLDAFLASICHTALFDKSRNVTVRFAFERNGLTITHEPIGYIDQVYRVSAVNL